MADPVSIGAMVASALAAGATEAAKGALGQAAKDLYAALKARVGRWVAAPVDELEERAKANQSLEGRKALIAETVDEQGDAERSELAALAHSLIAALREGGEVPRVDVSVQGGGIAVGGTLNVAGNVAGRDMTGSAGTRKPN